MAGRNIELRRAGDALRRRRRNRLRAIASACTIEPLEQRRLFAAAPLTNVPLTDNADVQQQPTVAADPQAPQHLAVAYTDRSLVDTGYAGLGVSVSRDGGATWTRSSIPLPAGFEQSATHPVARFDDRGRLYVVFMAATFVDPRPPFGDAAGDPVTGAPYYASLFNGSNGIFVARSDDGGDTWLPSVTVESNLYDGHTKVPYGKKPDLAIDTNAKLPDGSSNPTYGNVYVIWSRYYPAGQFPAEPDSTGGSSLQVAVSTDRGSSFATRVGPTDADHPVPISVIRDKIYSGIGPPEGLGGANWAHVAVGPQGDVYVSYFDYGGFAVTHSTDAARTFDVPNYEDEYRYVFARHDSNIASPTAPQAAGPDGKFRTQVVRNIVPDPNRPGTVYAMEVVDDFDSAGTLFDDSDILFSRSTDYGVMWDAPLRLNPSINATLLNDDNLGIRANGRDEDVTARQFFARMAIDDAGNLAVIWYDTRHDPGNKRLDVFGTVSHDGGDTFAPNFRLSDQTFDPDAGRFTDALGLDNYHLGDSLGLSIAGGMAYAAWTDTRNGNQDIVFGTFNVASPPTPTNDRFEPNDAPDRVTDLGAVIQRPIPKLHIGPGDTDLYRFRSLATGNLELDVTQGRTGARLRVKLFDATGVQALATAGDVTDAAGAIVGQRLTFPVVANTQYTLRVTARDGKSTPYGLYVQALTAELGTVVHRRVAGRASATDQSYFLVTTAAAGSLRVRLTPDAGSTGQLTVDILDARTLETLASGTTGGPSKSIRTDVTPGKQYLVGVGGLSDDERSFALELTNLDGFATGGGPAKVFPAGNGPGQLVMADVNHDGRPDLVVSDVLANTVSVLLGNGDGSFQTPRQFGVGAFVAGIESTVSVLHNGRGVAVADFDGDDNLDIVVTNKDSADVSVLLGHGDGTFAAQRRADATSKPWSVDAGDINGDGFPDIAVIDDYLDRKLSIALLYGRGDGSFRHEVLRSTAATGAAGVSRIRIADVNNDGRADVLYAGNQDQKTHVLLGQPELSLLPLIESATFEGGAPGMFIADLNNDGNPDVASASIYNNTVGFTLGNGDGTFAETETFFGGTSPVSVAVADLASVDADGETVIVGVADGVPDIISAGSGAVQTVFFGRPQVMLSAGLIAADDGALSYAPAVEIATGDQPISLAAGDVDGDGFTDVAYVDRAGVRVFFAHPRAFAHNATRATARDLGTVVHVLEPTLTVVPGRADAWYAMTVPTEAARGSGDALIDFSALFEHERGGGLEMEVLDAGGTVLGIGEHIRLRAPQGRQLYVHVFGRSNASGSRGTGAYTLDIDVLPQVISLEGQFLLPGLQDLPGGPTTSLVLTLQGDRLDHKLAEDPSNYVVTWLGGDEQQVSVAAAVYNPSANVDISTGKNYPTAVRQTVTLLFDVALPAGSYRVQLDSKIRAASFNEAEVALIGDRHAIGSLDGAHINSGATISGQHVVATASTLGSFDRFESGTPFLSQFHGDLSALLDQALTATGDQSEVTARLLEQMLLRLAPSLGGATSLLALFLDPVGIDLSDPGGDRITYDLDSGDLGNQIANAFVSVAGNVELVVIPMAEGAYTLTVDDVPGTARGGAVLLGGGGASAQTVSLTQGLRDGQRQFVINAQGVDKIPDGPEGSPLTRPLLPDPARVTAPGSARVVPISIEPGAADRSSAGGSPNPVAARELRMDGEHLGGGDTTMQGEQATEGVDTVVKRLAEQMRFLLGRIMSISIGGSDAPRTEASPPPPPPPPPPPDQPKSDMRAAPAIAPASDSPLTPIGEQINPATPPQSVTSVAIASSNIDVPQRCVRSPAWAVLPLIVMQGLRRPRQRAMTRKKHVRGGDRHS